MTSTATPPRSEWESMTIAAFDKAAPVIAEIEQRNPLFVDDRLWSLWQKMRDNPRVLDIGCGYGRFIPLLEALGGGRYVGIDASESMIALARKQHPTHDFRVGNVLSLRDAVGEDRFDGFIAITTLMHLLPEHFSLAVANIRGVMERGGIGLVSVPCSHLRNEELLLDARNLDTKGGRVPEGCLMLRVHWNPQVLVESFTSGGFELIGEPEDVGSMLVMGVQAI